MLSFRKLDMTTFEIIKELADKQGKSLQRVSEDLGLSQNYIYNLKGAKSPAADKLALIADYFHVSVDYLLGRIQHDNDSDFAKILKDFSLPFEVKKLIKFADKFNNDNFDDLEYELLRALILAIEKDNEYVRTRTQENTGVEFKQFVKTLTSVVGSFYDGPIDFTQESLGNENDIASYFSAKRKRQGIIDESHFDDKD